MPVAASVLVNTTLSPLARAWVSVIVSVADVAPV
jgi:hypothetical protein